MLAPLVAHQRRFIRRTADTQPLEPFFEVQTLRGVADVIFAELDETILLGRKQLGVTSQVDISRVAVLHAYASATRRAKRFIASLGIHDISNAVGVSVAHLRRDVLPALSAAGWLQRTGRDAWTLAHPYVIPAKRLVAVEVKRSNWRRALSQASSHVDFADSTYVALDTIHIPQNTHWKSAFEYAGVGFIGIQATIATKTVPTSATVRRIISALPRRPRGLARAVVAERIANLAQEGASSGDLTHVFGQQISTAWGADPRRAAATDPGKSTGRTISIDSPKPTGA